MKIVLVTGGSRGIGRGIAQKYLEDGETVVATYKTNEEAAKKFEADEHAKGRNLEMIRLDIIDADSVKGAVELIIKKHGRIDVLVNNAGISIDSLVVRASDEDFTLAIDTNLRGTFNLCRNVARHMMKARSGSIVNITSVVGLRGNAGQSIYAATKAAIIGFSQSLAKELASRNVRVNAVAPGLIETDIIARIDPATREGYVASIPLGRIGAAADVASLVSFLSSDGASYITGETIRVDGGMAI